MSKHTPGPWCNSPLDGRTVGRIVPHHPQDPRIPGFEAVAAIFQRSSEETNANVRLIAAAPDLLAACERADHLIGSVLESQSIEDYDRKRLVTMRQMLAIVLTKANGEPR